MNKKSSKILTSVVKSITSKPKSKKRAKRGAGRRRQPSIPGILAGYGDPITSRFEVIHRRDGCVLRGVDLIAGSVAVSNLATSFYAPANPLAWEGTRARAVALGFQNYRPVRFRIVYRPQVGSTSNLSMFIGTIWQNNTVSSFSDIEPSLVTSPGGAYGPAWQLMATDVPLGDRLPQRMFPMRSNEASVTPFAVVCRSSAGGGDTSAAPMPGRIFFEYEYVFSNAVGADDNYVYSYESQGLSISPVKLSTTGASVWALDTYRVPPDGVITSTSDAAMTKGVPLFAHVTWEIVGGAPAGDYVRYAMKDQGGFVEATSDSTSNRTIVLSHLSRTRMQAIATASSRIVRGPATSIVRPDPEDDPTHIGSMVVSNSLLETLQAAIANAQFGPVQVTTGPDGSVVIKPQSLSCGASAPPPGGASACAPE